MSSKWTRRQFVKTTGTAAGALVLGGAFAEFLAACASSSPTTSGSGSLEIFSWWTAGGEADGLAEMFKIYQQKYPGVKIVNAAVAGGAGSNAKAVLATRMQGGKPPDSFQVHAGQELISTWVKADKMEPITSIWNSEGWDSVIPKDLKTIVSKGSDVWSVPVNVHRGNALWVNLAKPGSSITPGTGNNWKPDTDFTGSASPGTEKTYMIVCDTFGLPKGAPDRDNAINWIKVCGSEAGQAAFNPKKGSIPARTDVPASIFDSIAQKFIAEFKTDSLTPSIAHGSAAPEAFASGVNDEMGQFVQKKDVNASASNIAKLADQYLK